MYEYYILQLYISCKLPITVISMSLNKSYALIIIYTIAALKRIRLKFWNFLYYYSDLTEIFTQYVKSKKKHFFQIYFFLFLFRFLFKTKKTNPPLCPPFWGGSSAASPLKIWNVMPPYLKTLFEQKTEI